MLDLIMIYKNQSLSSELLRTSQPTHILGKQMKVLSPNGIAITNLLSFRLKDQDDLFNLLPQLDGEYLQKWVTGLNIDQTRYDQIFKVSQTYLEENYPDIAKLYKGYGK
jgi:hypothetical protein